MDILILGIDVSQDKLDVCAHAPDGEIRELDTVANTHAGFAELAASVDTLRTTTDADEVHLVMEPTGGYEQPLARFALAQDWRVYMPNPHRVRQWAEGVGYRAKTDQVDAEMLAEFGAARDLPDWQPLPDEVATLETLLQRQEDLKKILQQERNRLHALTSRECDETLVLEGVRDHIADLEVRLDEIETAIKDHVRAHPKLHDDIKLIQTVPGVGRRNVYRILVLLYRWGTLTDFTGSSKALTAYVGLDPQHHRSGTSVYRPPHISKKGDPIFRRTFYWAAFGGVRGDNALRHFYQRLVGRGKAKQLALVAAARKVLIWTWAVFRDQRQFQPELAGMSA